MQNELSKEELDNIVRIKLFSILEYLEQQIEFVAKSYPDAYLAYQNSKTNKPKIAEYEESTEQRQN
jgi:hypothetical protein